MFFLRVLIFSCLFPFWICSTSSCKDNDSQKSINEIKGVKLLDDFESYQSLEEVKGYLSKSSLKSEVIEDNRQGGKDGKPPFHIFVLFVRNYSHLGCNGELLIRFFNNRLMETWFYPSDYVGYIKELREQSGLRIEETRDAKIGPHTKMWIAVDYKGKKYVGWEDTRLKKEFSDWIKKYS